MCRKGSEMAEKMQCFRSRKKAHRTEKVGRILALTLRAKEGLEQPLICVLSQSPQPFDFLTTTLTNCCPVIYEHSISKTVREPLNLFYSLPHLFVGYEIEFK
jgi:hypothetical protein